MRLKHLVGCPLLILALPLGAQAAADATAATRSAAALSANRVQDAMAAGVRFVACGNSMQAQGLAKDEMIDGIAYAELIRVQQQGWAYLRP